MRAAVILHLVCILRQHVDLTWRRLRPYACRSSQTSIADLSFDEVVGMQSSGRPRLLDASSGHVAHFGLSVPKARAFCRGALAG